MKDKLVLVACPVVFKESAKSQKWFIVKQKEEEGWEIPKAFGRGGESSVRTAIRTIGEQGGMTAKVLEEAGRAGGATITNGQTSPVRHLYYLMQLKDKSGEPIGYAESGWFEYATAVRKLSSKRDKEMLKKARETLRQLEKEEKLEK